MDENTTHQVEVEVISNGDVATTNGDIDASEAKSKLVEYDCQSADITEDGGKVQKFSSKLKETKGLENGKAFQEKDYEESAQKSMHEKQGNTELGCSSSLQLAEKEKVSETSGGGVKTEYSVGSDEQYKSQASSVNKVGDANIETNRSSDSSYTNACSKIEEELPGDEGSREAVVAGRRVTEVSRGDSSHSEQISSNVEGPGGYSRSQGNLEGQSSNKHSHSTVTTPSGSSHHTSVSEKLTSKKESFRMESSSAASGNQLEEPLGAAAAVVTESAENVVTESSRPGVINLSTKISSDDGDLLGNAAASSFSKREETVSSSSKFEHTSSSQKESNETSTGGAPYSRQHPDTTPSDNMSVSSMSSAHDLNDIKMSSASSSECAYASKMETNEMEKTKDSKYNRKSTDSLVKRILGESEKDRKSKYKINMGGEEEGEEFDKDSLLQRRLASLDKSGRRPRGGDQYMVEEYEHEELTYSRKSRGRMNRQGSGDQEPPRGYRGGRQGSRGSFEFDDDYEDQGYDRGYRGRGRFARQQYIDDDDVFGPPPPFVPLFRDEEFEPQKRDETEDYVKEKTASIRGMVDQQTVVLENLRKASESFDELTDEIKNIRQAFIENQARRSMMFREDELPYDEEQARDQPRGRQKPRSRYVQQKEEDYEFAIKDERRRKNQYAIEDYGFEQELPGQRGRQKLFSLEGEKDNYDYGLSAYGKSKGLSKDLDDLGSKSYGIQDDYLSYGRSKLGDYTPKSQAGQALLKKSYYCQEDYTATYGAGADAYNRRARGLVGRSKSLYDEASGAEKDGFSLEDGATRRGRIGLQRTQYDPLSDDITPKDRYGVSAYGSGGSGYTRVGDPVASPASSAYSGASARSSYTSSRLSSSAASSSSSAAASSASTRPRLSRSRTLSDIDFDRAGSPGSGASGQNFQSRFLGKVRQRSLTGEDTSRSRDKPFKSRFLRSNFDLGDGSDSASSYTSTSASARMISKTETKTESKEE